MSGQESIRGYIFQSIIAVLDSLQSDWESICIEPNIGNDKIDIIWVEKDQSEKVCQVKSSINNFGKTEILDWILGLYSDNPKAKKYSVILVGNSNSNVKSFFNTIQTREISDFNGRFKIIHSIQQKIYVEFYPFNYETLRGAIISLIHKFLSLKEISVDYFSQELIADGLVNQIMVFSTTGSKISKSQFEQKLLGWIQYNYSNCFSSTNKELYLSFYLTNRIDFQDSINVIGLPEISDSKYIDVRKEELLNIFSAICDSKVEENIVKDDKDLSITPVSNLYRFELPRLLPSDYKYEPVIITESERSKIILLTDELLNKTIPQNFFGFGDLKESRNSLSVIPWGNKTVLSGSTNEKAKKELYEDYEFQLKDLDDLLNFWNEIRKLDFLPIVLRNDSTSYEQGLRVKLIFPKKIKIYKPTDFPKPERYEVLKKFNDDENIFTYFFKHHKDSKVNEYYSKKFLSANFDTIVTLSSMKSFSEKEKLQIDRYYEYIDYNFDFEIFEDQSDKTIIECEIDELSANEVIALPSFIFIDFNEDFTIEYEINSKTLSGKINGILNVKMRNTSR